MSQARVTTLTLVTLLSVACDPFKPIAGQPLIGYSAVFINRTSPGSRNRLRPVLVNNSIRSRPKLVIWNAFHSYQPAIGTEYCPFVLL